MAIDGRMMPAGTSIPNVIDAKQVPTMAARRRRMMVGAVDNFPHSPRILDASLHSRNSAATSSVDWALSLIYIEWMVYRVKMFGYDTMAVRSATTKTS